MTGLSLVSMVRPTDGAGHQIYYFLGLHREGFAGSVGTP